MGNIKHNYKITDRQFIEALRACKGNYTLTSAYIEQNYGISYSIQAVHNRAKNFPAETEKIIDGLTGQCSLHLITFIEDETADVRLRTRVQLHILNKANKLRLRYIKANANKLRKQEHNTEQFPYAGLKTQS